VLDDRLVHEIGLGDDLARARVEQLLLDAGVQLELVADALDEVRLLRPVRLRCA
jgi:hypothetical protein